jgi:hypothetical protein
LINIGLLAKFGAIKGAFPDKRGALGREKRVVKPLMLLACLSRRGRSVEDNLYYA